MKKIISCVFIIITSIIIVSCVKSVFDPFDMQSGKLTVADALKGTNGIENSIGFNTWVSDRLSANIPRWYTFSAVSGKSYYIYMDNASEGSGNYSGYVKLSVLRSDKTVYYVQDADKCFVLPQKITAQGNETVYIRLLSADGGTFAVEVSTNAYPDINILYPANNTNIYDRNPAVAFTGSTNYTGYLLELFTNQSMINGIFSTNITSTNCQTTNLPFGSIYIKITPYPMGNIATNQFMVAQIGTPFISQPSNSSIQYNKLSISWNSITGADGYQLYMDNNIIFTGNTNAYIFPTNITSYAVHNIFVIATNRYQTATSSTNQFTLSNKAPVIVLNYQSYYITNTPIVISAGNTWDNEGDALLFNWNNYGYTSDNSFTTNIPSIESETIPLSVKDNFGNIVSTNIQFNVTNEIPNLIIPVFTISSVSGNRSTVFNVDASGTSNLVSQTGTIWVQWNWGDGYTSSYSTGKTSSHQYSAVSNFAITLTATNSDGFISNAATNVSITNRPPAANFTLSATNVYTNQVFTVNAGGTSDPDGDTLQYQWNFGSGFTPWMSSNTYSYSYSYTGTNTVYLQVQDIYGGMGSTNKQIVVKLPASGSSSSSSSSSYSSSSSGSSMGGVIIYGTITNTNQ